MQKSIITLTIIALVASSCGLAKKQTKITVENFVGKWKAEYISEDPTDDLINYWFELYLEKDTTQENSLKGWHCSAVRGGRQIDCVDKEYGEEPSLHGYLKNDTVYLHFDSSFSGEGEAELYFSESDKNLSNIIWKVSKYKIEHHLPLIDTLKRITDGL